MLSHLSYERKCVEQWLGASRKEVWPSSSVFGIGFLLDQRYPFVKSSLRYYTGSRSTCRQSYLSHWDMKVISPWQGMGSYSNRSWSTCRQSYLADWDMQVTSPRQGMDSLLYQNLKHLQAKLSGWLRYAGHLTTTRNGQLLYQNLKHLQAKAIWVIEICRSPHTTRNEWLL